MDRVDRKLSAILAADVAGYSRLMGLDEEGTLARLTALRRDLFDPSVPAIAAASSRRPATGCWPSSPASSTRCAARSRSRRKWPRGRPGRATTDASRSGSGSMSATSSTRTATSSATASTSRRGWRGSPSPADLHLGARRRKMPRQARPRFEDIGEQQLKNIARPVRAYRFALPATAPHRPRSPALPLPDKPSIAVLPFQNMSGDPEQEYFADGIAEDIITALSKLRGLLRHRPQFELHLQGPRRRREAGRHASLACAMCSKAASARPATACG